MALGCVQDTQYSWAEAAPSPTIAAPRCTPAMISGLPLGRVVMWVRLLTSPRESPENAAFPGCGGYNLKKRGPTCAHGTGRGADRASAGPAIRPHHWQTPGPGGGEDARAPASLSEAGSLPQYFKAV